ncbi:MAG: Gfo/Idh/MocA family oxidoreductase, partial [Bacteroidales bacterium]|nr:Gfo/Idh/MocA family oxidoreductase [Bacteroidales bacterium]
MMSENKMDRRSFLGTSAKIGVVGVVGGSALLTSCAGKKEPKIVPLRQPDEYYIPELPDKAIEGKELKAGVIGCGGRGSGAIFDLLNAADGITVIALGDTFADRLGGLREKLKANGQEVPEENCFVGFDAYKKVIDSGVDMVVIATPPVFRPTHFQYATEKGVHSFLEKPIAVDAKGYRLIMATAKQTEAKG